MKLFQIGKHWWEQTFIWGNLRLGLYRREIDLIAKVKPVVKLGKATYTHLPLRVSIDFQWESNYEKKHWDKKQELEHPKVVMQGLDKAIMMGSPFRPSELKEIQDNLRKYRDWLIEEVKKDGVQVYLKAAVHIESAMAYLHED